MNNPACYHLHALHSFLCRIPHPLDFVIVLHTIMALMGTTCVIYYSRISGADTLYYALLTEQQAACRCTPEKMILRSLALIIKLAR